MRRGSGGTPHARRVLVKSTPKLQEVRLPDLPDTPPVLDDWITQMRKVVAQGLGQDPDTLPGYDASVTCLAAEAIRLREENLELRAHLMIAPPKPNARYLNWLKGADELLRKYGAKK